MIFPERQEGSSSENTGTQEEIDKETIATREVLAGTLLTLYRENPEELDEMAEIEMLSTSNTALHSHVVMLANGQRMVAGEDSKSWFQRGASTVFLYACLVAHDIDHVPPPIVTSDIIKNVRDQRARQRMKRQLVAEHLDDQRLTQYKSEELKQQYSQLDEPLRATLQIIVQEAGNISSASQVAFFNSAVMTWELVHEATVATPPTS